MVTYFITGANRGLGLELVKQLSRDPSTSFILAAARQPSSSKDLEDIEKVSEGRLRRLECHVDRPESFASVAEETKTLMRKAAAGEGIDVLINNAGVWPRSSLLNADAETFDSSVRSNVTGPLLLTQALHPLMEPAKGKKVFNMASGLGSIAKGAHTMNPLYSITKAGLNMLTRKYAAELGADWTVVSLDPGWVSTDMGGPSAPVTPEESIAGLLKNVILKVGPQDSGTFKNRHGVDVPW